MQVLLAVLVITIILVGMLWILIPAFHGLPPISTHPERIRRALRLAGLQPGETLCDLGSGHGRVLVIAAKEFDANAIGIEAGFVQNMISRLNAIRNGVSSRVRIETANFLKADLSRADVIYAYLTSEYATRLREKFGRELRGGVRIVTISFDLPGWAPEFFDRENLIYLYKK